MKLLGVALRGFLTVTVLLGCMGKHPALAGDVVQGVDEHGSWHEKSTTAWCSIDIKVSPI
jgi:hypothetical protein